MRLYIDDNFFIYCFEILILNYSDFTFDNVDYDLGTFF